MEQQEQYQQGVPQVRSTPYASPMHQFGSSILLLTNPENELYKMELTFRGMKVNKEGNPEQSGQPLMNDHGISSVLGLVQSIVNQVTVMSNLSKSEVPVLMDFLGDTISKDLMINKVAYGITSESVRDRVFFITLSSSFITLKRAYEEGDKRFWKGSVQEISTRVEGAQKKNSLLAAMNPWSKK